jgi:hypothetical protein
MVRQANGKQGTHSKHRSVGKKKSAVGTAGTAYRSFLVRIWQETRPNADNGLVWRGTVSDLEGRHIGSFTTVTDILSGLAGDGAFGVLLWRDRDDLPD